MRFSNKNAGCKPEIFKKTHAVLISFQKKTSILLEQLF